MVRIAIVGVGAIGGVCAANLIAAGHDVTCCVRTRFRVLAHETGEGTRTFAVTVATDPEQLPPVDWALLATKAHHTASAAGWLARAGRVAVLQNGVEHVARLASWIEPARIVPVVVSCPTTAIAPGRVVQRGPGRFVVPDDRGGRELAALFATSAIAVEATADWPTTAWRKLCSNVTGGALAALAGAPVREVMHRGLRELARALAHECASTARAEGADVPGDVADAVVEQTVAVPGGGQPSTLTDRLRGRPLEVDARNGTVVRFGARHRVAVPANTIAAELMTSAHLDPGRDLIPELWERFAHAR